MKILGSLTVRKQLIATFILVTIGFIVGTAVGDRVSARMHEQAEEVYTKALIPISSIGDIMRNVYDARAQLLLGLQHDPSGEWAKMHDHAIDKHLDAFRDAVDDAKDAYASYAKRGGLPDEERRKLEAIGAELDGYFAAGDEVVAAFKAGNFHQANLVILQKINPAMSALTKKVAVLETDLIKHSKQQNADNGELRKRLAILMWASAGLGIVLLWGMYFFLTRNITKPLLRVKDAIGRVAQGDLGTRLDIRGNSEFDSVLRSVARMQDSLREITGEIQEASQGVSRNAQLLSQQIDDTARRSQTQSDRILEITAALEEMSHTIEEISGGAHGVDSASQEARGLAEHGAASMDENLATVNKIVATVHESSGAIQELCDAAHQISELAGIIKDIAGQTNLLALNAAIEAARAGEQGRGFAVVADEVRKLAERTASSSANIGQLLDGVGSRSDEAIAAMRQVMADVEQGADQTRSIGETLRRILGAASQVSDLTRTIAAATQQQSEASVQTVESMNNISSLTDGNNAAIQQVAVAASEMNAIAGRLQGLVGRFRFAG